MEENTERRMFYIDVGDAEPDVLKAELECLFFEFKDKEVKDGI